MEKRNKTFSEGTWHSGTWHSGTWKQTYKIWEDNKEDEAINIKADSMNTALDLAAIEFGYIDYSDMAQNLNWDENDGLHIERK